MVRKFDGQQDATMCEMTLSGSHLIATYVRRCGGRRRTLVGRWAGWVDRRACGFEAALSTTELQATTLLVYNNLPLVLMLWPGNWQIYVCDKKFEGQWKTKMRQIENKLDPAQWHNGTIASGIVFYTLFGVKLLKLESNT